MDMAAIDGKRDRLEEVRRLHVSSNAFHEAIVQMSITELLEADLFESAICPKVHQALFSSNYTTPKGRLLLLECPQTGPGIALLCWERGDKSGPATVTVKLDEYHSVSLEVFHSYNGQGLCGDGSYPRKGVIAELIDVCSGVKIDQVCFHGNEPWRRLLRETYVGANPFLLPARAFRFNRRGSGDCIDWNPTHSPALW